MDNDQITALAREYAEEKTDAISFKAYSDPEFKKKLSTKGYANDAREVIEWLLRRYCLVEKSKAVNLCRLTLEHGDSVDYGLIDGLTDVVWDIFSRAVPTSSR